MKRESRRAGALLSPPRHEDGPCPRSVPPPVRFWDGRGGPWRRDGPGAGSDTAVDGIKLSLVKYISSRCTQHPSRSPAPAWTAQTHTRGVATTTLSFHPQKAQAAPRGASPAQGTRGMEQGEQQRPNRLPIPAKASGKTGGRVRKPKRYFLPALCLQDPFAELRRVQGAHPTRLSPLRGPRVAEAAVSPRATPGPSRFHQQKPPLVPSWGPGRANSLRSTGDPALAETRWEASSEGGD